MICLQPGAGTTVERQVEGEFGDRSPAVLKPNQTKKHAWEGWGSGRCIHSANVQGGYVLHAWLVGQNGE